MSFHARRYPTTSVPVEAEREDRSSLGPGTQIGERDLIDGFFH
jgi:hypothetical protein